MKIMVSSPNGFLSEAVRIKVVPQCPVVIPVNLGLYFVTADLFLLCWIYAEFLYFPAIGPDMPSVDAVIVCIHIFKAHRTFSILIC